jgi:hypothetical protein
MRGVYTAQAKIAGLNAQKTLMYLTAPAGKVVEIIAATVTNESNATNQQLAVAIDNVTTLGTPTATAVTPTPHEAGDQAAASTVKANVTASEPTYGSRLTAEGATSLLGYRHEPAPEERLYVAPGASVGIRLLTTPTAFDCDVRLTFREIG